MKQSGDAIQQQRYLADPERRSTYDNHFTSNPIKLGYIEKTQHRSPNFEVSPKLSETKAVTEFTKSKSLIISTKDV